jgi:hypothetical protein
MENNIKNTAFEWYIEQHNRFVLLSNNMPIEERIKRLIDLVDKTKEMEKQQIIDACWAGGDDGEQYYNETYGHNK